MTFEDLKRCLILLSYDTVRPEDESQTWHNVLPYTFEDGCLLKYELDGDDDIDHNIDLDNYAGAQVAQVAQALKPPYGKKVVLS